MRPAHILIALIVPLTWGFGFVSAKAGLGHFPPLLLMAMRFLLAGAILVWLVPVPWEYFAKLSWIAFIASTLQYGLTFSGLALIDATPAVLLVQSEVIFGLIIAALMLGETPNRQQIIGMVVAIIGVIVILGAPSLGNDYVGMMLVLSGACIWSFGQVMVRSLHGAIGGFQLTAWLGIIAGLQMSLASLLIEGNPYPLIVSASLADWAAVIYLGIVMTVIGYSAWYFVLGRYPVPMVMPVLLLLPPAAILGAVVFLGETAEWDVLGGGALVLFGVGVTMIDKKTLPWSRQRKTEPSLEMGDQL